VSIIQPKSFSVKSVEPINIVMSSNIYEIYQEFVSADPRSKMEQDTAIYHHISDDFHTLRHSLCLAPEKLKGKRVLDLGSCLGATGAWVLHHGAEKYVGVEIQQDFASLSENNLGKYFDTSKWEIITKSFDDFFKSNTEEFDIVIALEVLYTVPSIEVFLKNISELNAELLVIDSLCPPDIKDTPMMKYDYLGTVTGTTDQPQHYIVESAVISVPGLRAFMNRFNYKLDSDLTIQLRSVYEIAYSNRYCITLVKGRDISSLPLLEEIANTNKSKLPYNKDPGLVHWSLDERTNFSTEYFENLIVEYFSYQCVGDTIDFKTLIVHSGQGSLLRKLSEKNFHHLTGYELDKNNLTLCRNTMPFYFTDSSNSLLHMAPFDAVVTIQETIINIPEFLDTVKNLMCDAGFAIISTRTAMTNKNPEIYDNSLITQDLLSFEQIQQYSLSIGFNRCELLNRTLCFDTFILQKY
jgi:Methyltransferase domain